MQTKLEKKAEFYLNIAIDEVFIKLHEEFKTKSGDITPEQDIMLTYYLTQLQKLIVQQVKQNF
jgi:hypothetical protein